MRNEQKLNMDQTQKETVSGEGFVSLLQQLPAF